MLLRKKPLKWNDFDDSYSMDETEAYVVEHLPGLLKVGRHFLSGWELRINQTPRPKKHPTRASAKQAAEEHWATVVPPGCERVKFCQTCCETENWGCLDCDGEGVVEVK